MNALHAHKVTMIQVKGLALVALYYMATPGVVTANDSVSFDLVGEVTPRCEVTYVESGREVLDMTETEIQSIVFGVDCNLPMDIELRSDHGGMAYQSEGSSGSRGTTVLYDASLTIDNVGLRLEANSRELQDGIEANTGNKIPFETEGLIDISMTKDNRLPAGQYADRLHITVSPSLNDPGA